MLAMLLVASGLHVLASARSVTVPTTVVDCLDKFRDVHADMTQNPFYLRGFLDSGSLPDYAVAVIEEHTKKSRMLVCLGNGKIFRLGFPNQRFSDMPSGDYMSRIWYIATKKEIQADQQYYKQVPSSVGEVICLLWEDGEAFIYWDGERFRWMQPPLK